MSAAVAEAKILTKAKDLITPYEQFTWGCMARDAKEKEADHMGEDAVKWCAKGAIYRAAPRSRDICESAERYLADAIDIDEGLLAPVIDRMPHDQVLRAFDRAIDLAMGS